MNVRSARIKSLAKLFKREMTMMWIGQANSTDGK